MGPQVPSHQRSAYGKENGVGDEVNRELAMVVNKCYQKSIANFAWFPS